MNKITFFNYTIYNIDEQDKLEELINYAALGENVNNSEINFIFVNDTKMAELNIKYRQIKGPTDVLSFVYNSDFQYLGLDYVMLGDIYISIDRAHKQAKEYGHTLLEEISFLMVHGFLHLLGYNHMDEKDKEEMFKRQEEILNGFRNKE
ncbi:MAG: rRNA maturation RNase YbeY [Bacilli bacterium]|jgi:probable rRNA maturation factor